jgi:hypothetical protein
MCGEGQITCGVYAPSFGPARIDSGDMRGTEIANVILLLVYPALVLVDLSDK